MEMRDVVELGMSSGTLTHIYTLLEQVEVVHPLLCTPPMQ